MNIYIAKTKFVKYAFYALYIHHIYIWKYTVSANDLRTHHPYPYPLEFIR